MFTTVRYILFFILMIILGLLVSCGGESKTSEVGAANFTLAWQEKSQGFLGKQAPKGEICSANGIDQIKVSYLSGSKVVQSQTFECSPGTGTVTGIPVGSYTLAVEGLSFGVVRWRGGLATVTIEANKTSDHGAIVMTYVGPSQVTPSAGAHGSIIPASLLSVNYGAAQSFTITPESGYSIVTPIGGSCPQGTLDGNVYTIGNIIADCTVAPTFSNIFFSVTPSAGINGSISPSTAQTVAGGSVRQFVIIPNSGYQTASVTGCNGTLSGTTYTTGAVAGDCTVSAAFSILSTYAVSGTISTAAKVGIQGVYVSLTGNGTTSVLTDSNGFFSFNGVADGSSYSLSPVLSGYTFVPLSRTISISGAGLSGQNFTGIPLAGNFTITGSITYGGSALAGVTVTLAGSGSSTAITDSSGNFSFSNAQNGSYSLTPVLAGYIFTPSSQDVTINAANLSGTGFVATAVPSIPSALSASAVSSNLINLAWGKTNNGAGYEIERTNVSNGSITIISVAAGITAFRDTGLSASTTYSYRVRSIVGAAASEYSAAVTAATSAQGAVITPQLVNAGSFSIGKFEVTQGEWLDVMGTNPSSFLSCGLNCPVENVSWDDVQNFISTLNSLSGMNYRLPTEAEWQYAAQSGGTGELYSGSVSDFNAVAWYSGNAANTTHPVGQKQGNGLGIYDMSGNVWEWVSDLSGANHVSRGGSWINTESFITTTRRAVSVPGSKNNVAGFRLAK